MEKVTSDYRANKTLNNRILFVTSGYLDNQSSGSNIAYRIFDYFKNNKDIFFFGTSQISEFEDSKLKIVKITSSKKSHKIFFYYRRYVNFNIQFKLLKYAIEKKIKYVNFHIFSDTFPITLILTLKLLRIKSILTHHDYTAIRNTKLYPSEIFSDDKCESFSEDNILNISNSKIFKINRLLANCASSQICLSEMQYRIFKQFGFKVDSVLENRIEKCKCLDLHKIEKIDNSILFAGRMIGKGFTELVECVAQNSNIKLYLAGNPELIEYSETKIPKERLNYLGILDQVNLFQKIHQMRLVYVASTCLDVGPTMLLEALVHRCSVVTSFSTGHGYYVAEIDNEFRSESITIALLEKLLQKSTTFVNSNKMEEAIKKITKFETFYESYMNHFKLI